MRRLALLLALTVLLPVAATTSPSTAASTGSWPQAGHDSGRSHYQPVTGGLTAANAAGLHVAWQRDQESINGVAYAGGKLYAIHTDLDHTSRIRRIDPATGTVEKVLRTVALRTFRHIAVVDNTIYVQSIDNTSTRAFVSAYTMNGTPKWERPQPDNEPYGSAFAVGGGLVVIATGPICAPTCAQWMVRAYRSDTGALRWTSPLGGYGAFEPAVIYDGRVIHPFNRPDGSGPATAAFDAATGAPLWTRSAAGPAAAWGGAVYTAGYRQGCSRGVLTGARRWCHDGVSMAFYNDPAFGPDAVYLPDTDGRILRLRPATGELLWTTDLGIGWGEVRNTTPPVSGGGVVYSYARHRDSSEAGFVFRNEIVAVRASDGAVLGRVPISSAVLPFVDELILVGGRLFLVGSSLIALTP